MRKSFYEYYGLTTSELDKLWKNGLIVFDTNVLLSLYRRPIDVRDDILNVLKGLKERIWLPQQVGFEYHEDRMEEANRHVKAIKELPSRFQEFSDKIQQDYQNNPYIDYKKIKTSMTRLCSTMHKHCNEWLSSCPDFLHEDKILEVLTELFESKVGDVYDKSRLEEIYKIGAERYANRVPPGYKDRKKKDGEQHRYGDLIIWLQIMEKAKAAEKDIIFVTDDEKEDWWEMFEGFKTGPCRSLIKEFRNNVGNHIIWFYTTERFLTEAKKRVGITIKPKTIEETKRPVLDYSKIWGLDAEPGQVSIESWIGTQSPYSVAESELASIGATSFLGRVPHDYRKHLWSSKYTADGSVMGTISQLKGLGYGKEGSSIIDNIDSFIPKDLGNLAQDSSKEDEENNSSDKTKTE